MRLSPLLLVVLISAATSFGVMKYVGPASTAAAPAKETAFERVMRTGTLRCGYIVWAPYLSLDPQTGEKTGILPTFMKELGSEMGWKIEWTEETGWGSYHEGLNTGRYDAMCMPVYETGGRAKISLLTEALFDQGLYVFSRAQETRFDESFDSLNTPEVTIAMVEGDVISRSLKDSFFPQAKEYSLPQMVDKGQYMLSVATRKADAAFTSPYSIRKYNEGTTDELKMVGGAKPVTHYGSALGVKLGEYDLKFALDSGINALMKNGKAKTIIDNHKDEGLSLPSPPY